MKRYTPDKPRQALPPPPLHLPPIHARLLFRIIPLLLPEIFASALYGLSASIDRWHWLQCTGLSELAVEARTQVQ